jgi:hypothetical protein
MENFGGVIHVDAVSWQTVREFREFTLTDPDQDDLAGARGFYHRVKCCPENTHTVRARTVLA